MTIVEKFFVYNTMNKMTFVRTHELTLACSGLCCFQSPSVSTVGHCPGTKKSGILSATTAETKTRKRQTTFMVAVSARSDDENLA